MMNKTPRTQELLDGYARLLESHAQLQRELAEARRDANAKQAQIDALMLEFCPDEMTQEQKDEWAKNQVSAIDAAKGDGNG